MRLYILYFTRDPFAGPYVNEEGVVLLDEDTLRDAGLNEADLDNPDPDDLAAAFVYQAGEGAKLVIAETTHTILGLPFGVELTRGIGE